MLLHSFTIYLSRTLLDFSPFCVPWKFQESPMGLQHHDGK